MLKNFENKKWSIDMEIKKFDEEKVYVSTAYVMNFARKYDYEYCDTLEQLLDDIDTIACNQLDDEDK